jgi:hypothetical protein
MTRRTRSRAGGWALVALALAACGDASSEAASERPPVAVDTVDGTPRFTYPAAAMDPLAWTVDTVTVIGDAMAEEEYQFGAPGSDDLAGHPDGTILVLDRDGGRVLEYAATGEHVATYGRKGEGPGELRFGAGVTVGPGDTIWVNDLMNRRLTAFPHGGGDPRSVPYARSDVFPGGRIAAVDGGFLQVVGEVSGGPEAVPEPLLRLDADGSALDTIWKAPRRPMDLVEIEMPGRSIHIGMQQHFWPEFHWRALSDGTVVLADDPDYVFRIIGPDGASRRIVRREPAARETTEEDRQAVRDSILAEAESGFTIRIGGAAPDQAAQRRMAEQRVENMTFAERIPRILRLHVDPADRIWVGVSEDVPDRIQRIDVYDRDGRLLGELRDFPFPRAFVGEELVLVTTRDEMDVPQVVVLRVDRSAGAER